MYWPSSREPPTNSGPAKRRVGSGRSATVSAPGVRWSRATWQAALPRPSGANSGSTVEHRSIASGQRGGEVRPGPVERQAVPLMVALQGLTALALTGGFTQEQLDQGVDETIAFILRGYAP